MLYRLGVVGVGDRVRWALLVFTPLLLVVGLSHPVLLLVVPFPALSCQVSSLVLVSAFPAVWWRSTPPPDVAGWGLGCLAWALTPAAQGPRQQSTVQERQAEQQDKDETEQEGERGQSPLSRGIVDFVFYGMFVL
jgi:hypothetical protein